MAARLHPDDGDNSYQRGLPEEVAADQEPYKADVAEGRFFPVYGNHDYGNGCTPGSLQPSLDYFKRPENYVAHLGNGLADFFALDINCNVASADGTPPDLLDRYQKAVNDSPAMWRITSGHQPPYSSGHGGNNSDREWVLIPGVDLFMFGHDHHFEHQLVNGKNMIISGAGGKSLTPLYDGVPGSLWRDNTEYGATRLTVTPDTMTTEFVAVGGKVLHAFTLKKNFVGQSYLYGISPIAMGGASSGAGGSPGQNSGDDDEGTDGGANPGRLTRTQMSLTFDANGPKTDGLLYKQYEDGPNSLVTVEGQQALQMDKSPFGDGNYVYLDVDDTVANGGPFDAQLTLKYRSNVPGSFYLQYDNQNTNKAYHATDPVAIAADQVGQWQTVTIPMPAAMFRNRENGSSDMRLVGPGNLPLVIGAIDLQVKDGGAATQPGEEAGTSGSNSVSVSFGDQIEANGMTPIQYESGPFHLGTFDGQPALQMDRNLFNSGNNLYVTVTDSRIHDGPFSATLTMEYLAPVAGSFLVQYESANTGSAYENSQAVSIGTDEAGQWQTATIALPDVRFRNRLNGESDMRLRANENLPLVIRSMRLDVQPAQ